MSTSIKTNVHTVEALRIEHHGPLSGDSADTSITRVVIKTGDDTHLEFTLFYPTATGLPITTTHS